MIVLVVRRLDGLNHSMMKSGLVQSARQYWNSTEQMTIKLTKENLRALVAKMKDADPDLMAESAIHRGSAIAEFGRVHFGEYFELVEATDSDDDIMEADWNAKVRGYTVNGVYFEEEEVRTIVRLHSPHR